MKRVVTSIHFYVVTLESCPRPVGVPSCVAVCLAMSEKSGVWEINNTEIILFGSTTNTEEFVGRGVREMG